MLTHFDLFISADYPARTAEFTLRDGTGRHWGYKKTAFGCISASHQQGLFDLSNYLRLYVEKEKEREVLAEIGVCIAQQVLGKEIFEKLWESTSQRTLRIVFPGESGIDNLLAAALARVPWELARRTPDEKTLAERNLLVRLDHDRAVPASHPLPIAPGEPLRVLFVFAEAVDTNTLWARKEHRVLAQFFGQKIYPYRRIEAHFLTHGATRERLRAQIEEVGGYHIVHWSGHGSQNRLELSTGDGQPDHLSGQDLLELFVESGGFFPHLFFLSACHSGDILRVKDWQDFLAVAQGKEPATRQAPLPPLDLGQQPGYTSTAHALRLGGVPCVVAMRYAVTDDYARELALEFYDALLAHRQPKSVAAALTMARRALAGRTPPTSRAFRVCDHATPVLYGEEHLSLTLAEGRSPIGGETRRRLHRIAELTMEVHAHFVGRSRELSRLGSHFVVGNRDLESKPVAVITGLGGMGKTALVAETMALWEEKFDWVLLYSGKPNALDFEDVLENIHNKLMGEMKRYAEHVQHNRADAIFREVDAATGFDGPSRLERLIQNLVRAMRDEAILIVLDNFETSLKDTDPLTPHAACKDRTWDEALGALAKDLKGSRSRVLITSRRPLAVLPPDIAHNVMLGPLPSEEAALYLRENPALHHMVFGSEPGEKALALRLLNASRFHPLLMDRLAKLAAHPSSRSLLMDVLETLEKTKRFDQLPALFAATRGGSAELAYLEDALASSLDQLIGMVSRDARQLLWVIAIANQPETLDLVKGAWSGQGYEEEKLRQIKNLLEKLESLPPQLQTKLRAMPPEIRAVIDSLPPADSQAVDPTPLLNQLVNLGLVNEERDGPEDLNPELTCHELVRERIREWMAQHEQDRGHLTTTSIRLAYAERLEATFYDLFNLHMTTAIHAGSRALVYCVEARAWSQLGRFASSLITSTRNPDILKQLEPHLRTAARSAPEGAPRRLCLCTLADALDNAGQHEASLPIYEALASELRTIAEAGGDDARQAWDHLSTVTGNCASPLYKTGKLSEARERHNESAEAARMAGLPEINVLGSEIEALRIDIKQGHVEVALPKMRTHLARVWRWWRRDRTGLPVPEAPHTEILARTLVTALNVMLLAYFTKRAWPAALRTVNLTLRVETILKRPIESIAALRVNRANVLAEIPGRFNEAKAELEACLLLLENHPAELATVIGSLASLLAKHRDIPEAITQGRRALAKRNLLSDPADRSHSHGNLANYLMKSGAEHDRIEAGSHQLAALLYQLTSLQGEDIKTSLHNYATLFYRALTEGATIHVPCLADLLMDPAFTPLASWLQRQEVDLDALQRQVDRFMAAAQKMARQNDAETAS